MRFRTAAFVTAAALTLAILPAATQEMGPPGHPRGHGDGEGNPILHMAKELGLNDSQMTQVKAITDKYNDGALGKSMDQARQARGALMRTVHDVNATEAQVRDAAANVALAESESAVTHHRMAIEISALLTADQRAKLADMFAHMEERHGGPRGGHDGL